MLAAPVSPSLLSHAPMKLLSQPAVVSAWPGNTTTSLRIYAVKLRCAGSVTSTRSAIVPCSASGGATNDSAKVSPTTGTPPANSRHSDHPSWALAASTSAHDSHAGGDASG